MSPVIRLHLLGVLLLGISICLTGNAKTENFRMLLLSGNQAQFEDCKLRQLADVLEENINPYEGMDVLSFISSLEKAVESKADAVVLPHSIIMESENSILKDYLKKLTKENQIVFLAPKVGSKGNIFSDFKSYSIEQIQEGKLEVSDLRIRRKLGKFTSLLKGKNLSDKKWSRLKVYM